MAWPLSRILDFVDENVPQITAAFLNALQDAQIAAFNGTQSLKALVVDGVGGNAVTPTAGWAYAKVLRLTQAISTTTAAPGTLYPELVPFAVAVVDGGDAAAPTDPTVIWGPNVLRVARRGGAAGQYRLVLRTCPARFALLADATTVYAPVVVTTQGSGQICRVDCQKSTDSGNAVLVVDVTTSTDTYFAAFVMP